MMTNRIDNAIAAMTEIIDWSIINQSKIGYYAVLYRVVTIKLKESLVNFEYPERIENLAVTFAYYYINSFKSFNETGSCSYCWEYVFNESKNERLTILQQLILGINVHINYDLPKAIAEISKNLEINELEEDFLQVNQVLHGLVDEFAFRIAKIWGRTNRFEMMVARIDKIIISIMMRITRSRAWREARKLHNMDTDKYEEELKKLDRIVTRIAKVVIRTRVMLSIPLWFRQNAEAGMPSEIINKLLDN